MADTEHSPSANEAHAGPRAYVRLLVMAGLSFVAMYLLMYAMVDSTRNVYANLNQVYMAGLMTAPMMLIEMVLMRDMYPNKRFNALAAAASALALVLLFALLRRQAAISDTQFLRSMIPHHGGAILMCREAPLADPEILALCDTIIASQQAEIEQMRVMLEELER